MNIGESGLASFCAVLREKAVAFRDSEEYESCVAFFRPVKLCIARCFCPRQLPYGYMGIPGMEMNLLSCEDIEVDSESEPAEPMAASKKVINDKVGQKPVCLMEGDEGAGTSNQVRKTRNTGSAGETFEPIDCNEPEPPVSLVPLPPAPEAIELKLTGNPEPQGEQGLEHQKNGNYPGTTPEGRQEAAASGGNMVEVDRSSNGSNAKAKGDTHGRKAGVDQRREPLIINGFREELLVQQCVVGAKM